jgi:hypothetical protein
MVVWHAPESPRKCATTHGDLPHMVSKDRNLTSLLSNIAGALQYECASVLRSIGASLRPRDDEGRLPSFRQRLSHHRGQIQRSKGADDGRLKLAEAMLVVARSDSRDSEQLTRLALDVSNHAMTLAAEVERHSGHEWWHAGGVAGMGLLPALTRDRRSLVSQPLPWYRRGRYPTAFFFKSRAIPMRSSAPAKLPAGKKGR